MANKLDNLRISLSRYAVLFATRARKAESDELLRLSFALELLNQAQHVVGSSENEAKKLLALARNIANTGAQDESKSKPRQLARGINEHGKKSIAR